MTSAPVQAATKTRSAARARPLGLATLASAILAPCVAYGLSELVGSENALARIVLALSLAIWAAQIAWMVRGNREHFVMLSFALFNVLGLIFPAMLQVAAGAFPFYSASYPSGLMNQAAALVLGYSLALASAYFFAGRKQATARPLQTPLRSVSRPMLSAAVPALVLLTFLMFFSVGSDTFLLPRLEAEGKIGMQALVSPLVLIPVVATRVLGFLSLATTLVLWRLQRPLPVVFLFFALSVPAFFLTNAPYNEARFSLLGFLIALMGIAFDTHKARIKSLLVFGYVFGVLVVMPALNVLDNRVAMGDVFRTYRSAVDYDGFQSIMNALAWTDATGVKWGSQLLSALLFFVPHTVWPGKALATGVAAARFTGYPSANVSAPLPVEFYSDFGFMGMILLSALAGWLLFYADRRLGTFQRTDDVMMRLPFVVLAGFSAIIVRGALLSIIGPTVAAVGLSWLLVVATTRPVARQRSGVPAKRVARA